MGATKRLFEEQRERERAFSKTGDEDYQYEQYINQINQTTMEKPNNSVEVQGTESAITDEQYSKSINHWNYFVLNFDNRQDFLDIWGERGSMRRKHFEEKWDASYERAGSLGAMLSFWANLDYGDRIKLTDWVKENYEGSPL